MNIKLFEHILVENGCSKIAKEEQKENDKQRDIQRCYYS